jgi:hypothetical protein
MHAFIAAKVRAGAPPRARSLLARAGAVWIWPGVPLTEKRGAACVPVVADVARFWISRLHGPAADEARALRCLAVAVRKLNTGDEVGAQSALDASGLTRLSPDGAALGRALAASLYIAPLDLPFGDGPRLWTADDVAAHAALFKDHARAAGLLAKAGGWDESKHPRVPAGSPGGGQFQGGQGGGESKSEPAPGKPVPLPPPRPPGLALASAAANVNPTKSGENCGNIIDAVVARLRGTDRNATAPAESDGVWSDIEQRLNTKIQWGTSLDSAYHDVAAGGDGTIGVLGITYSNGRGAHVVVIANDHGTVGIVEGQDWGKGQRPGVITDPKRASARYSPDGGSDFGFGILPRKK